MHMFLEIGLANAIMASALALLAAGVSLFCRRPAVRHTLWLLVLLKLVTPPLMTIPVACPAAVDALLSQRAGMESTHPRNISEGQVGSRESLAGASGLYKPSARGTLDPAFPELPRHEEEECLVGIAPSSPMAELSPEQTASGNDGFTAALPFELATSSLAALLCAVWFMGTMLWFVVAGRRIYCFQRLLRYARTAPASIQDQTRLLAQRLGLARCPTVLLVPGRISPLLWALGRKACLVIPADLLERLGPEQRSSLLAHELAHARRRDHWVRWLEFAVSGLYWWLPVTWWARSQLQQAEEECCDAWVVWTLPAAAKAYAKALLQTVDFLDARPALPPVASGVGHVHFLKRRLTMIVRQPLCPCLPWGVQLGVIVLGLLVLPLAPQRLAAQNSDDKSVSEGATDTAVVRAEEDPADRDVERRLRTLEEKMDRLLQKLDGQRGERSEGRSSREEKGSQEDKERAERAKEKARAAAAEQRAKAREMAEKAKEKARAERDKARDEAKSRADQMKELGRTLEDDKGLSKEQIQRLIEEIQAKVSKELDPKRMKELQKRIEESVNKNINPERMEEIQRRINDAMKKSTQQLNEALKKSTEQLDKAKKSLMQAEQQRASTSRTEKGREQEGRDLERRMDKLEQKMDRVLQALEKQGKSGKGV